MTKQNVLFILIGLNFVLGLIYSVMLTTRLSLDDHLNISIKDDINQYDKKGIHNVQHLKYEWDNGTVPKSNQTKDFFNDSNILTNVLIERFIVIPKHKLLFCYIDKVGCTMFNKLFFELEKKRPPPKKPKRGIWFKNTPEVHNLTKKDLEHAMMNPEWTKAVFYREPKERFLSGYTSKCVKGHDNDVNHCKKAFGLFDVSFEQVLHKLETEDGRKRAQEDVHFREAGEFCGGLTNTIQYYDFVEELTKETAPVKVQKLLEKIGVERKRTERLVNRYVATSNFQTKEHVTNADKNMCEYYTNLAKISLIEDIYKDDYKLFNISRNKTFC